MHVSMLESENIQMVVCTFDCKYKHVESVDVALCAGIT